MNYNPRDRELYLDGEDLIKIANSFLDQKIMNPELKNTLCDHIEEKVNDLSYEITAELAVIYASKMDKTYRDIFFNNMRKKFLKELKFLKEETLYKIMWSMIKSEQLKVSDDEPEWIMVKDNLKERSKELSPKCISDILLLSTLEARDQTQKSTDLFTLMETELILKMKSMSLDDLLNLLWSSLEMNRGSQMFFDTLETELAKRVRGIKDD